MSPAIKQSLQRPISLFSTFSHHQMIRKKAKDLMFFTLVAD